MNFHVTEFADNSSGPSTDPCGMIQSGRLSVRQESPANAKGSARQPWYI